MENGGAWFALSLFGMITGGIVGSFLGLLLMILNRGASIPIPFSTWGFYIGGFFGAHFALQIGMRRLNPEANAGSKLQIFSVFGAVLPVIFLLACRAIQSSAN